VVPASHPLAAVAASLTSAPTAPLRAVAADANARARAYFASASARSEPAPGTPLTPELRALVRHCALGELSAVEALLASPAGAALTGEAVAAARVERGGGALHHAAAAGHGDLCELLVRRLRVPVDARAANDSTPLHWAAGSGQEKTVSLLLSLGADPLARSSTWCSNVFGKASGQMPLHWAAESGHERVVALLAAAAPAAVAAADEKDVTPAELARKDGMHAGTVALIDRALDEEYVLLEMTVNEVTVARPLFVGTQPAAAAATLATLPAG
jgi:hypothetical protein